MDGRAVKNYLTRKRCQIGLILGFAVLAFVFGIKLRVSSNHTIEGIWVNQYYGQCLCGSYNFFEFKEDQITLYSELHETDYEAGSYQKIEEGLFKVVLANKPDSEFQWEVKPGRNSWIAPPDEGESWVTKRFRRFYRPRSTAREMTLIKAAASSDANTQPLD